MGEFLTFDKFQNKVNLLNDKYWNDSYKSRWVYMEPVIKELKTLSLKTALELGSNKISLMNFSDSMGLKEKFFDTENLMNRGYVLDSRNTPWDIEDKKYDVFVALQVLEHLSPNQSRVFSEIKRIARHCIITLPYKWDCPENIIHHNIGDEIINEWTNHIVPYKKLILGNKNRLRIMLCYKFE